MSGELGRLARKQSKYFSIEIGEEAEAIFEDYKIIPSTYDPEKDMVQYKLTVEGITKFWLNGSGGVMRQFDSIPKGSKIKITRHALIDKDGNAIQGKSMYKICQLSELDAPF
jgi:hypothetical protein